MRTIQLVKIEMINFKGVKSLCAEFAHNTDIFGQNKAGKTTIFDAWTWVLFGKDSQDRKDFEIAPLDEKNKRIEKINSEVIATLIVEGEEIVLRKVLVQKWTKKKGSSTTEFTGNTIEHYFNNVPLGTAREYQEKVNSICDETVFKLITNPAAFMSLKWQDRRSVLINIADKVTDKELATGNRDFESLIFKLTNNKTLEEYAKEIAASIKKAKADLADIPTRIDEVVRSKAQGIDFNQVQNILEAKTEELEKIEASILDKSGLFDAELEAINKTKSKVNELKNWLQMEEIVLRSSAKKQVEAQGKVLNDLNFKLAENKEILKGSENGLVTLGIKQKLISDEIAASTKTIDEKRAQWIARNAEKLEFDDDCFNCPTCKRMLEVMDIETQKTNMLTAFNTKKQADLLAISASAKQLQTVIDSQKKELEGMAERIENGKKFIKDIKDENDALQKQIDAETIALASQPSIDDIYNVLLKDCQLYHDKKAELQAIESNMVTAPQIDFSEFLDKKKELVAEIAELNKKLHQKQQIKIADDRIKQLQAEEIILAEQILNVERTQFIIDNFNRVKTEHLENSINSKLKTVKFKMFEKQINGGESPICEALLNGVPYSNVNTAGRLNIGLDIINMLSEYYQVSAPVIIDNRESVTEIIECQSQIINLVVSPEDEKLRIETAC